MTTQGRPPQRGMGIGQMLLYITIISLGAVFVFRYLNNAGYTDYTMVPQEMQINYVPAEFDYQLDEENALAVLSNPHRYRREFNDLVYDFNLSLLHHVANRMNLPDSLQQQLETEYQKHHHYLKQLYFNDFVALKDTSSALYEMWYANESTSAVEVLTEVASKYTCFLVNHVISTLVKSEGGKLQVKGRRVDSPCAIAMTEGLKPMMDRLQERAAVMDFSRSQGLMEEKVEKVIAELATMEVKDKKGLNKQLQTKVLGYAVSSTDIEISAISILKVGFRLDDYFDLSLSQKNKKVVITLPEPVILSHEVFPKVDKLDVGWLREVSDVDFNKNFNILRSEFRREALESDIFDKAKEQVTELMSLMLGPLLTSFDKRYKIEVAFKNTGYRYEDDISDTPLSNIGEELEKIKAPQKEPPSEDIPDKYIPK